jgi:hypothetical protein
MFLYIISQIRFITFTSPITPPVGAFSPIEHPHHDRAKPHPPHTSGSGIFHSLQEHASGRVRMYRF